jgi:hypothetical protein
MQVTSYGFDALTGKIKHGAKWKNTIVMMWFFLSRFILNYFLGSSTIRIRTYIPKKNSSAPLVVDTTINVEVWHTLLPAPIKGFSVKNVVHGSVNVPI